MDYHRYKHLVDSKSEILSLWDRSRSILVVIGLVLLYTKAGMERTYVNLNRKVIQDFCKRWKIQELALFGSFLRDDFGPDSDLDILVTFDPEAEWGLFDHVAMQVELRSILDREVDIVTRQALERSRNWIRRNEILRTARVIYSQE